MQKLTTLADIELFPYQKTGAAFLAGKKLALLADQMGLGKTAQVITAAMAIKAKSVLVFCPAIARFVWLRELQKFAFDGAFPGFKILTSRVDEPLHEGVTICSYDLADMEKYHVDLLVLDESHYVKSKDAKRTRIILGKSGWIHHADRAWALSGTPAPNHAAELWPLLVCFGATKLSFDAFVREYCRFIETTWGIRIVGTRTEKTPELKKLLSKIMLRRTKKEVLPDLPPTLYGETAVPPGEIDVDAEILKKADEEQELLKKILDQGGDVAMALEGMAQSISTLRRIAGLRKVKPVAAMIKEELELGLYDKIVVFGIHKDVVKGLWQELYEFNPAIVYGETTPEERIREVERFQDDPDCKVFIGNIQAAGTAITLTAASNVIFAEMDWVPGNNVQAASRCHRIGQKSGCVNIRFVSLTDSVDFRVTEVVTQKTRELSELFEIDKPNYI